MPFRLMKRNERKLSMLMAGVCNFLIFDTFPFIVPSKRKPLARP